MDTAEDGGTLEEDAPGPDEDLEETEEVEVVDELLETQDLEEVEETGETTDLEELEALEETDDSAATLEEDDETLEEDGGTLEEDAPGPDEDLEETEEVEVVDELLETQDLEEVGETGEAADLEELEVLEETDLEEVEEADAAEGIREAGTVGEPGEVQAAEGGTGHGGVDQGEDPGGGATGEGLPEEGETQEPGARTVELAKDEELEEVETEELSEEELRALEEFRRSRELAEHFDGIIREGEKHYNLYSRIPAGTYTVGSRQRSGNRMPLQTVDMPETHMAKFPVTNAFFGIFIEQTGYVTTAEKRGSGTVYYGRYQKRKGFSLWQNRAGSTTVSGACWYQPEGPGSTLHGRSNHPVVQVGLDDAWAFASWVGRRLPTEAEWEAAARTDRGYPYPWGDQWKDNACNMEHTGISGTLPVDSFEPNGFNISDLLGNVMEWTSDRAEAPFTARKPMKLCVVKGGGWMAAKGTDISARSLFRPDFTANTIGFRCISEFILNP
jgi:formylglycine-generating enzyme required for sulfatase activity